MPYRPHNKVGKPSVEAGIRDALRKHEDGLTEATLKIMISTAGKPIEKVLTGMADAYIDRWIASEGEWTPVWCVVKVPENCPMPEGSPE